MGAVLGFMVTLPIGDAAVLTAFPGPPIANIWAAATARLCLLSDSVRSTRRSARPVAGVPVAGGAGPAAGPFAVLVDALRILARALVPSPLW